MLENGEDGEESKEQCKCPQIMIEIEGVKVLALVDTGSEVTCLREDVYVGNLGKFQNKPKLPVTGTIVRGALKGKPTRIKIQAMLQTKIGTVSTDLIYLIVPNLAKSCILGYDSQQKVKMVTDPHENVVMIKQTGERLQIGTKPSNSCQGHCIQLIQEDPQGIPKFGYRGDFQSFGAPSQIRPAISRHRRGEQAEGEIDSVVINEKINACRTLDNEQKMRLQKIIVNFRAVFRNKPGRIETYQHTLKMKDHEPFFSKQYPIPMKYREKVDVEIERLLSFGIIRKSNTPYINPVVIVDKKDGSIRICLDARELNKKLIDDHESPPRIESLFQSCHGIRLMTSLDLQNSFWQVPLSPESTKFTGFIINGKTYEFVVTPFGLRTSSAALERGLAHMMQKMEGFVLRYVDDSLIISRTFDEHLEHLTMFFQACLENKITLSFKKSSFAKEEAEFLGHIISKDGIRPQKEKIDIIKRFQPPKNVKQLKKFLGFINFYAKFTKNHAHETIPLIGLLKKGVKFKWTETHEEAFERVKALFTETVILAHPDPDRRYILTTDASQYAIAGILSQENDQGEEEVVTFISRTLKGAEINYFTTEKELLAIIWALKKLNSYLRGAKIVIRTDHQALTFLQKCKLTNTRLTRWILTIQEYDYEIEYIRGTLNVAADVLSRYSCEHNQPHPRMENEVIIATMLAGKPSEDLKSKFKKLTELQDQDRHLRHISEQLRTNVQTRKKNYKIVEDILYKFDPGGTMRPMLPRELAVQLIKELHELYGHVGARKIETMMKEDLYVRKLKTIVKQTIKTCEICQKAKHDTQGRKALAQTINPEKPGDLLSIDFYGPLPMSTGGVKHILVTIDAFSKLVVLYPIKRANTTTVIRKIFGHYVEKFGKPKQLCCDHGTQFTASKWKQKLNDEGIKLVFSSIRHPQSNIVERVNRELGRFFRTFVKDKHSGWARYVNIIQNCINETHHETTEYTPVELHLNAKPTRCWKNWIRVETMGTQPTHEEKLYLARERISKKRKTRADRINQKVKPLDEFHPGQKVLLKANNVSDAENRQIAKFFMVYEGPYEIQNRVAANTYILRDLETKRERGQFHANDLKPYHQ